MTRICDDTEMMLENWIWLQQYGAANFDLERNVSGTERELALAYFFRTGEHIENLIQLRDFEHVERPCGRRDNLDVAIISAVRYQKSHQSPNAGAVQRGDPTEVQGYHTIIPKEFLAPLGQVLAM